jgi:hypothetical protein
MEFTSGKIRLHGEEQDGTLLTASRSPSTKNLKDNLRIMAKRVVDQVSLPNKKLPVH